MNNCRVCGFQGEFEISECITCIQHNETADLSSDGYGEVHGVIIELDIISEYFTLSTCPECRITYKFKEQSRNSIK